MLTINNPLILATFICLGILPSCRKTDVVKSSISTSPAPVSPDLIKDSTILYTRDLYLWYKQIPSTFDARGYADPSKIMEAIHPYSIESGFTQPVDRWSFGMKKTDWDNLSAGISSTFSGFSSTGDFGLGVMFRVDGDLRVKSVERESQAGLSGVRRGWRILKINGNTNG